MKLRQTSNRIFTQTCFWWNYSQFLFCDINSMHDFNVFTTESEAVEASIDIWFAIRCGWLTYLLTYGTTTNTCLRPVEEDLSISAYLEHSASNLWPLGPGYRCSPYPPTWISVFLDFSFHWVWLWIGFFVIGLRVFWSCDQRSAICLSSWHLGHSGC
jgi:hypothetical protein